MTSLTQESPRAPSRNLVAFFNQAHRLPSIGDSLKPWHYCGWLLPYVMQLHCLLPAVADRWGYHLRTLEAGKLLDEPIPQIAFLSPNNKVFTLLHDWSRLIGWDCGGWADFRTLLDWLCWGLALTSEEPRLSEQVNEKLYRQVNVGPLLEHPYDYLGDFVAQGKAKGWNPTAFYPTPHSVAELMVRMTMADNRADGRDPRLLTVNDPCVGSGRLLLHASNISLNLFGQDIDPLAVAMCKINGALYAPWLSFPLPASILDTHVKSRPALPSVPDPAAVNVPAFRVDDQSQGLLFPL